MNQDTALTAIADDSRALLTGAPAAFRMAFRAIAQNWWAGSLTFVLPSGRELHLKGETPGPDGRLVVRDFRFMRRVLAAGDIGFAEGYMAGEWDSPDLSQLLEAFAVNFSRLQKVTLGNPLMRAFNGLRHALRGNTRAGAKRNIHAHYDLGNAFY
ncbi:MAG: SAM-dependent methyltransferase, partial [Phenylobacterium sp.]